MRKNELIEITIDDVTAEGHGIGRVDGLAVFVENALPGDRLRARILKQKKRYAYAKIHHILEQSPHRLPSSAACPAAGRCGGCQWSYCAYPAQLTFKKKIVKDALSKIAGIPDASVEDVIGMDTPLSYRHKAQFPVGSSPDGHDVVTGFYAPRSHRIVPVKHCRIQHPSHEPVLEAVRAYMSRYHVAAYDENIETGPTGLIRHILIRVSHATGEIMVVPVVNGARLPHEASLITALLAVEGVSTILLNVNTARTNVILGDHFRILHGSGTIRECIGDITYQLSARSFFQVNPVQAKILYDTVLSFGDFNGSETIIDAHAGAGGLALYAARSVHSVIGVEIVPDAVDDANRNAMLNGIENVRFVLGAAEDVIPGRLTRQGDESTAELSDIPTDEQTDSPVIPHPDAVILDPPRKGCGGALIEAIVAARIPKVIYVSCDPATLARDIGLLREGGYVLEKVQPVDMFPMTGKVECVALLKCEL